jgi:hypothetical protein
MLFIVTGAGCAGRPLWLPEVTSEPGTGGDLATADLTTQETPDLSAADLAAPTPADLGGRDLAADLGGGIDLALGGIRFAPPRALVALDTWNSFRVGDFNGDGKDDLVARDGQTIVVLLGDATQPLNTRVNNVLSSSYGFLSGWGIADFDLDGHLDVALGVQRGVMVLAGAGDGTFQPGPVVANLDTGGGSPVPLAGDFNGDGFSDVAYDGWMGALTTAHPYLAVIAPKTANNIVSLNLDFALSPHSTVVSDFDVDGHLDLLVNTWSNALLFVRGDGHGGLAAPVQAAGEAGMPAPADLDGDGVPDLVFAHPDTGVKQTAGSISYRRGLGDGSFAASIAFAVSPYPEFLAFADFDRDGHLDVAAGSHPPVGSLPAPLQVLRGAAGAALLPAQAVDTQTGTVFGLVSGDFDGDGRVDLVFGQQTTINSGVLPTQLFLLRNISP